MLSRHANKVTNETRRRRWFARRTADGGDTMSRTDLLIGAGGVVLGVTCALFPWYIFFNQEQFGPPKVRFEAPEAELLVDDALATPLLPRDDRDVRIVGIPDLNLDFTPTGSLPRVFSEAPQAVTDQPFPEEAAGSFKVLHVTAGRAMIEDDAGIWIVEPGARLPDLTSIQSIERRKGKWVLITSDERVLRAGD